MAETPEEVATCKVCGREKADENTDRAGYTPYATGTPDVLCWAGVFVDGAHECYRLGYERLLYALGPALRAQYVAGLERAAEIARAEADEYLRNAKACDASGNTFGGSMDTNGASACRRVDSRIRELAEQAKRAP